MRDWTTPIAIYGAALSTLTAAVGALIYLIQIDDVRLIVNGTLDINGTRDVGGDVETVTITAKPLRMTFSNAGNRAVIINSVRLTTEQKDREAKYQACQNGQTSLEMEPVQLKADEISIIKEMQVSGGRFSYKPCDIRDSEGNVSIRVSPVFEVITPDNQVFPIGEPLKTASFGPGHTSIELSIVVFADRNTGLPAQTLYHRRRILGWTLPSPSWLAL
jgi:hypothetical protein